MRLTTVHGAAPHEVVALNAIDPAVRRGAFSAVLTAVQNIALPFRLARRGMRTDHAHRLLEQAGWASGHRAASLSGGQQQRAANPEAVFADEPTGALDSRNGCQVLALPRKLVDDDGRTVVMATHDPVAAAFADRVTFLADGRISGHLDDPAARVVADLMTTLEETTPKQVD